MCISILTGALCTALPVFADEISSRLRVVAGPINSASVDGGQISVYRTSPEGGKTLLLTHARRDAVGSVAQGVAVVAPAAERALVETPDTFWVEFAKGRFHDYAQQSTKVLGEPIPVHRWVKDGDVIEFDSTAFRVMETPGYTRGSVSYLTMIDGKKVAFTGDLIYGDGKILDLYSFQDAIPEAQIRGYHGYGSRLAALVDSLEKVKATEPDVIVPARGPVIEDPATAIDKLVARVRKLYRNYLSTSALNWYFKEDRMRTCGERVLGKQGEIELMDYATHIDNPDWIFASSTSRLLISDDGRGFLLDCGSQRVIETIQDLADKGLVSGVDGIFVTHFHDDHTDAVQAAAEKFECPVYALEEYSDVLEDPGAYHLPAMTSNAVANVQVKKDGQKMNWREFEFTFHFYPGQTYYHGGLFVRRPGEKPVFFIGDSFSPSGIDDYCLQNRNLVHADTGYPLCFQKLRFIKEDYWLVNEHIPHLFRFSDRELTYLETRYAERAQILRDLFPWDDPNYGIDEQWAVLRPYGLKMAPGSESTLNVIIENHSPVAREFTVKPRGWRGIEVLTNSATITLRPREKGPVPVQIKAASKAGWGLVTADILSEGMDFSDWVEAMVEIE